MGSPMLTIAIPTKDRPEWLRRALMSVLDHSVDQAKLEILVSDNSTTSLTQKIAEDLKQPNLRYWRNTPPSSMVANWNILLSMASGKYVLWLHDDDFLLPGSLHGILQTLKSDRSDFHAFSARIVDDQERPMKRGGSHIEKKLCPRDALLALFTHSSFIRFPSAVVLTDLAKSTGGFIVESGDLADLCLWSRLASSSGIACHALNTVAYTVHSAQATSRMFQAITLLRVSEMARRYERIVGTENLNRALGRFFWRFVLGGATRALRKGDLKEVKRILHISDGEMFHAKPCPTQWLPLRGLLFLAGKFG